MSYQLFMGSKINQKLIILHTENIANAYSVYEKTTGVPKFACTADWDIAAGLNIVEKFSSSVLI